MGVNLDKLLSSALFIAGAICTHIFAPALVELEWACIGILSAIWVLKPAGKLVAIPKDRLGEG